MKRLLLATTMLVCPFAARAQIPVTDIGSHIIQDLGIQNQYAELVKWVKQLEAMEQQYQMMINQYNTLVSQYNQLKTTYDAIAHPTDIMGEINALQGVSRTYMPDAGVQPSLMGGTSLWGNGQQMLTINRFYSSTGTDPRQIEMQRRETATANAQAISLAAAQDAQQGIRNLEILRARLVAAKDTTDVVAVNGLIALEQQRLDNNRAQLQAVQIALQSDDRVSQQRDEQIRRQSSDQLFTQTHAATDTLR